MSAQKSALKSVIASLCNRALKAHWPVSQRLANGLIITAEYRDGLRYLTLARLEGPGPSQLEAVTVLGHSGFELGGIAERQDAGRTVWTVYEKRGLGE